MSGDRQVMDEVWDYEWGPSKFCVTEKRDGCLQIRITCFSRIFILVEFVGLSIYPFFIFVS